LRELGTRLILGPAMFLVVGAIYWLDATRTDGILSVAVLGLMALAACHEYAAMFRGAGLAVSRGLLLLATLMLCLSAPWTGWRGTDENLHGLYPMVVTSLVLLFLLSIRGLAKDPENTGAGLVAMSNTVLGFILVAWPLYLAQCLALFHLPSLLFVVLVCKAGDSGAYLLGRALGRHKLIPHVSPGKTVEGAIAGLAVSGVVAVVLTEPLLSSTGEIRVGVTLTEAALVGIMLSITAQIGDLVESQLKRRCHVKDSSRLLPFHGGVLDLVDSLLFSFPAHFLVLGILS